MIPVDASTAGRLLKERSLWSQSMELRKSTNINIFLICCPQSQ